MPKTTIPLVGPITVRTIDGEGSVSKDQRFINCIFIAAKNSLLQKSSIYCEKRPGWEAVSTLSSGNTGQGISYFHGTSLAVTIVGFGDTNTEIFDENGTSYGSISGMMLNISDSILVNDTEHLFIRSTDDTAWYLPYDVYSSGDTTFTGDTHSNTTIDNIAGASALHVGQSISGSGIQAGTRIASIVSATQITITIAATATAAGVTLTRGGLSKIIDSDFPTGTGIHGNFIGMDGYVFTCTPNGRIYNSDLNSADSWSADNFIPTDTLGDRPIALAVTNGMIACFSEGGIEYYQNVGNPSNSPLQRIKQNFRAIGLKELSAITQIRDDIYFCSSLTYGGLGIYKLSGFDIQKVSTPQVDNILGTQASDLTQPVCLSSFVLGGQSYVQVVRLDNVAPLTHERTLVYNIDLDIWSEWSGNFCTFIAGTTFGAINRINGVTRGDTGGKLFRIRASSPGYADDNSAYTQTIQTEPYVLNNGNGFTINSVELIADKESAGTVAISTSADDYGNFSSSRNFEQSQARKRLYRFGYFKNHAIFKLEQSGAQRPFRGQALVVDWEPCQT